MLVIRIETPDSARVSPSLSSTLVFLSVLCQEFRITKELSRPARKNIIKKLSNTNFLVLLMFPKDMLIEIEIIALWSQNYPVFSLKGSHKNDNFLG